MDKNHLSWFFMRQRTILALTLLLSMLCWGGESQAQSYRERVREQFNAWYSGLTREQHILLQNWLISPRQFHFASEDAVAFAAIVTRDESYLKRWRDLHNCAAPSEEVMDAFMRNEHAFQLACCSNFTYPENPPGLLNFYRGQNIYTALPIDPSIGETYPIMRFFSMTESQKAAMRLRTIASEETVRQMGLAEVMKRRGLTDLPLLKIQLHPQDVASVEMAWVPFLARELPKEGNFAEYLKLFYREGQQYRYYRYALAPWRNAQNERVISPGSAYLRFEGWESRATPQGISQWQKWRLLGPRPRAPLPLPRPWVDSELAFVRRNAAPTGAAALRACRPQLIRFIRQVPRP